MGSNFFSHTQKISEINKNKNKNNLKQISNNKIANVLKKVAVALEYKGYDPTSQIVGYILSGDPSYITAHDNARNLISKLESDEILEEIVKFYFKNNVG